MRRTEPRRSAGFTLIELLTVIAVIGILAAILIPTVSSVRLSANKAKTKVQFTQWAAAIESFRSEYGYYPAFHSTNLVNGGATGVATGEHLFHDILAGRKRDGKALSSGAATQNRKRIAFYTFSEGDLTDATAPVPNLIKDAFENTEIAVLVDKDLDGKITTNDFGGSLPMVNGMQPTYGPASADIPQTGLRVRVAFYAPAPNATANDPQFIFSWK